MIDKKASTRGKVLPNEESTAKLSAEVQNFASQLGLAAAGVGAGFNDSDFRPALANKHIGAAHTKQSQQKIGRDLAPQADQLAQRRHSNQQAGPSNRGQHRVKDKAANDSAVKGRAWNAGVGLRPGEKHGRTLLGKEELTVWHEALEAMPQLEANISGATLDEEQLEQLRNDAEAALENEAVAFENDLNKNRSESRWLQQVRQSGTTADKLAAMTLLIRESALANLKSLDELLRWVGKRSSARGVAVQAIDALRELFCTVLLPDRKLLFFEQQSLGSLPDGKAGRRHMLYFYMEDAIKKRYLQFVKALQEASRDNLEFVKQKSIKAIFELLRAKPEQEALLLAALVDKLGDSSRRLASNVGYLLGLLLEEHPAMKMVVAQEVERFICKPHLPARAVYYGIVFLNQIVLSHRPELGGSALAKKLINIFFDLFRLILEGKLGHASELRLAKEEQKSKHTSKKGAKQGKRSQRPLGQKNNQAKQPVQTQTGSEAEVDAKLLGALLAGVRRAFPFVDAAETEALMEQHSTALFRVLHTATFGVAVQALSLLFQLLDARLAVSDRFYRALYGVLLAPDVAKSTKSAMFLSLLYKAMKADISDKRIIAFIKRILQVTIEQLPNFACGCLLLVSELLKDRPSLWGPILEPEEAGEQLESFQDRLDDEDAAVAADAAQIRKPTAAGRLARYNSDSGDEGVPNAIANGIEGGATQNSGESGYDMGKREPLHCKAEQTCVWELVPLAGHVHPSVAAMARALLAGVPVDYAGDPLRDLSTTAFLDKFIQKKPKAQAKGASLMQPLAKVSPAELISPAFAMLSAADVAPDTAYFHKFYEVKAQREAAGVRPKGKRKKSAAEGEGPLAEDDEDSLADSDAGSEEVDDFLEGVEDSEDEAAPGDYDNLAAAMRANAGSIEDSGDEDHAAIAELSDASADAGASPDTDDDDMSQEPFEDSDTGAEFLEGEDGTSDGVSEDIDAFELAEPSDDEDDEASYSADEESDDEWVMAPGAELLVGGTNGAMVGDEGWILADGAAKLLDSRPPKEKRRVQQQQERSERSRAKGATLEKKRKQNDSDAVFASAEEYAGLLDENESRGGKAGLKSKRAKRIRNSKAQ